MKYSVQVTGSEDGRTVLHHYHVMGMHISGNVTFHLSFNKPEHTFTFDFKEVGGILAWLDTLQWLTVSSVTLLPLP